MFALSGYALTNGPDKSVLAPGNPSYQTIKQAMDTMVNRTLASQNAAGLPGATTTAAATIRPRRSLPWPA